MTRDPHRPDPADDLMLHQLPRSTAVVHNDSKAWFDRFYQCLHSPTEPTMLVIGAGIYPNADAIDGYACLVHRGEQRNLRFADRLGESRLRTSVGPLRWEIVEPMNVWRTTIAANEAGFELDAQWTARTRSWMDRPIVVGHEEGERSEFAHYFQPGRWQGRLVVDGEQIDLSGWSGPRDRSWGVRRARESLGMHLWVQSQFEDLSISVHYNEYRDGRTQHLDGAVLHDDGRATPIVAVEHAFDLDQSREFVAGELRLEDEAGEVYEMTAKGRHPGLYMAGAGYGGGHGIRPDGPTVASERWPLDGSLDRGGLPLLLTDKLTDFVAGQRTGTGILEFASSRSSSYRYAPSSERKR